VGTCVLVSADGEAQAVSASGNMRLKMDTPRVRCILVFIYSLVKSGLGIKMAD
jgi:hypothetical protein